MPSRGSCTTRAFAHITDVLKIIWSRQLWPAKSNTWYRTNAWIVTTSVPQRHLQVDGVGLTLPNIGSVDIAVFVITNHVISICGFHVVYNLWKRHGIRAVLHFRSNFVSRDLLTVLTAAEVAVRSAVTYRGHSRGKSNLKSYLQKIITYEYIQSNWPIKSYAMCFTAETIRLTKIFVLYYSTR